MKKRGDKRGQFYLLAAFVIIISLVSLASVSSSIFTIEDTAPDKIYDLTKELDFESAKVVDYGIYTGNYNNNLILSWTGNYTDYSQRKIRDIEWVFVYGNFTNLNKIEFKKEITGEVGVGKIKKKFYANALKTGQIKKTSDKKKVTVKDTRGIEREFKLNPGENFYFIIIKEEKGGIIANTNKHQETEKKDSGKYGGSDKNEKD